MDRCRSLPDRNRCGINRRGSHVWPTSTARAAGKRAANRHCVQRHAWTHHRSFGICRRPRRRGAGCHRNGMPYGCLGVGRSGGRTSLVGTPSAAGALILLLGGGLVASGVNLIRLSIAMGVVNALLLPIALGFLFQLARTKLTGPMRLKGAYAALVGTLFFCAAAMGVYAALAGIAG